MKQRCINVVPTLCNVVSTLCNVVSTLFQGRALTLYQRCATSKICRRILFHFQRRINVIWTLIHNVETTLIRRWNVDLELSTVLYFPEELFTFTEEILIVELPFFTLLTRSLYDYLSKGKQQRLQHFYRSSQSQMFLEVGALENFANFTGKHLCWSLLLIKLQVWKACNIVKERLQHRCFSVNNAKFLRAAFFMEQFWCCLSWLYLILINCLCRLR